MTARVTLVIPTKDRPALLRRQLSYYRQAGFAGTILIADSTEQQGFQATSHWLREFSNQLSVRHYHLPGLFVTEAVRAVTREVRTPYVAVIPDDDFLIPSGIAQCADFLDKNIGYIAAHGLGILIESEDGGTDHIRSAGYYPQPVLSDDLASDRVANHLRAYSVTLYSTHRTEAWVKVFDATPSAKDNPLCYDRSFSDELLQCSLTAAYGKIAQIDCLYLVRQTHNTRNLLPAWYRWLTGEKWRPSYLWYRDKVAAAICEVDDIPLQRAQEAVDSGLVEYLQKFIGARAEGAEGLVARIRRITLRYLPASGRAVLRRYRSRFGSGYISFEGLMDPASPYHRDFVQIFKAVTGKEHG